MSRRGNKDADLDFVIHQDDDHANHQPNEEEEDSWMAGIRGGDDDAALRIDATDSNMTKASTLVNESHCGGPGQHSKDGPVETDIDSMLHDLKASTDKLDETTNPDTQHEQTDNYEHVDHDTASSRPARRSSASCYSTDAPDDDGSRRESGVTEDTWDRQGTTEGSESRRESYATSQGESSRRESGYTYEEGTEGGEDSLLHTEGSESRRESGTETVEDSLVHDSRGTETGEESFAQHDEQTTDASAASSRRESGVSEAPAQVDGRTEALIHAAARDIVEKLNKGYDAEPSNDEEAAVVASMLEEQSARQSEAHESAHDQEGDSMHDQSQTEGHSMQEGGSVHESVENDDDRTTPMGHEGADSGSSHHGNEDNVFSDHSPRSSFGTSSNPDQQHDKPCLHDDEDGSMIERSRSPPLSAISRYDDLDDEPEDEVFVSTVRGAPRPPFRSPSSVRALQMSSPSPSVIGSAPRSSKRQTMGGGSRVGSPRLSTQFSPKKTPPRFKRNTPPLVLLHATLLPLRWPWGHVLDSFNDEELSDGAKGLRGAWRLLHDRMGDTVCERGILLPHPQSDFEVLEERLLEALELPLRRRARILECGHYLGPSNEMTLPEDSSDDDDYDYDYEEPRGRRGSSKDKGMHWCTTCKSEIRYDSLGAGKVFRVKVYASNGLVKAGAWDACWKDMERVDVEVEPIVESHLHEELVRLETAVQQVDYDRAAEEEREAQAEAEAEEQAAAAMAATHRHVQEQEQLYLSREGTPVFRGSPMPMLHASSVSPPPPAPASVSSLPPQQLSQERLLAIEPAGRRWVDEQQARLRDPYGSTPPVSVTHRDSYRSGGSEVPGSASVPPSSMAGVYQETPVSPTVEAMARREGRRSSRASSRVHVDEDSLSDLLIQAARVMLQDRKNVMIALMSVLVLTLALRGGSATAGVASYVPFQEYVPVRQYHPYKEEVAAPQAMTVTVTQQMQEATPVARVEERAVQGTVAAPVEMVVAVPVQEPVKEPVVEVQETVAEAAPEAVASSVQEEEAAPEPSASSTEEVQEQEEQEEVESAPEPAASQVDEEETVSEPTESVVEEEQEETAPEPTASVVEEEVEAVAEPSESAVEEEQEVVPEPAASSVEDEEKEVETAPEPTASSVEDEEVEEKEEVEEDTATADSSQAVDNDAEAEKLAAMPSVIKPMPDPYADGVCGDDVEAEDVAFAQREL